MSGDRITQALARIDAAAGRIETAARTSPTGQGDADLAHKYEVLRSEASAALADLDRLIGTLGQ